MLAAEPCGGPGGGVPYQGCSFPLAPGSQMPRVGNNGTKNRAVLLGGGGGTEQPAAGNICLSCRTNAQEVAPAGLPTMQGWGGTGTSNCHQASKLGAQPCPSPVCPGPSNSQHTRHAHKHIHTRTCMSSGRESQMWLVDPSLLPSL